MAQVKLMYQSCKLFYSYFSCFALHDPGLPSDLFFPKLGCNSEEFYNVYPWLLLSILIP